MFLQKIGKFIGDRESGHTIVEVLVALAILSIALVPTVQFMAKVFSNASARDLCVATQLARREIENVISEQDFTHDETWVRLNQKLLRVEKNFKNYDDLVTIRVRVFKKNATKPLVELKTLRLNND